MGIFKTVGRALRHRFKTCSITLLMHSLRVLPAKVVLTYDNRNPKDGCGAQLQRILSIYALAKFLNLKYTHSEILDISTHALDPFQDDDSRKKFVSKLNSVFFLNSDSTVELQSMAIPVLNVRHLAIYLVRSIFSKKGFLLRIIEPYPVVDFCPPVLKFVPEVNLATGGDKSQLRKVIAMHYRYGVGGFANYHGRNATRQLEYKYYLDCLSSKEVLLAPKERIVMLTDAPIESIKFEPPVEQRSNWIGTPNFDGRYISIQQSNVETFFTNAGFAIEFIRGGDPLEAISLMANADVLIMGKSSLSYVAALLNKDGVIFFPKDFWHTPLPHWNIMA